MRSKRRNLRPLLGLIAASALGVTALAIYVKFTPANVVPESQRKTVRQEQREPRADKVVVYKPTYVDQELVFQESEKTVPKGEDRVVYAVNALLESIPAVEKGARLRSVKVVGHMAELDFTTAFETTYGTDDERTILNGILTVLGQFPEIETARFLVDGHPIESLGNVELVDPQPVLRQ